MPLQMAPAAIQERAPKRKRADNAAANASVDLTGASDVLDLTRDDVDFAKLENNAFGRKYLFKCYKSDGTLSEKQCLMSWVNMPLDDGTRFELKELILSALNEGHKLRQILPIEESITKELERNRDEHVESQMRLLAVFAKELGERLGSNSIVY